MELTLLLLSLAAGIQAWPQLPEGSTSSDALPYRLARSIPVMEGDDAISLHVPVKARRGLVEEWLGDEDPNAPVQASRRNLPVIEEVEDIGTLHVPSKRRLPVIEETDQFGTLHIPSKRRLPVIEETDPLGTLHVPSKRRLPVIEETDQFGTLHVPSKRRLPVIEEVEDIGTLPVPTFGKRSGDGMIALPIYHAERPALVKRDAVSMELENRTDTAYYAELSIGSPAQVVNVQLDSGSFELWVNPDCSKLTLASKLFCQSTGSYDPALSNTAKLTGETRKLSYGIGSADFEYVVDDISISDSVKLSKVQFGRATTSSDQFAGILGVGRGNGGGIKYNNLIDEMAEQGITKTKTYSVALGSKDEGGGALVFGGVDTAKYSGSLSAFPVIHPDTGNTPDSVTRYWISMESVSVTQDGKSKKMPDSSLTVFPDTGATLTLLPPALVKSIAAEFGTSRTDANGFYTVACDLRKKQSTVDFAFKGLTIKVPYYEIIREVNSNGVPYCYLGFSPSEKFALLGDTFLRSAYIVHDNDEDVVYMAQYVNCGTMLKTINKSSDIIGMKGSCKPLDDENNGEDGNDNDNDGDNTSSPTKTTGGAQPTTTLQTSTQTGPSVTTPSPSSTRSGSPSGGAQTSSQTGSAGNGGSSTNSGAPQSTEKPSDNNNNNTGNESGDSNGNGDGSSDNTDGSNGDGNSEGNSEGGDGGSAGNKLATGSATLGALIGFAAMLAML